MSEWIEELENNFKYVNHHKGDLIEYQHPVSSDEPCLRYLTPNDFIELRGHYSIDQLQDLVNHMKQYKGK